MKRAFYVIFVMILHSASAEAQRESSCWPVFTSLNQSVRLKPNQQLQLPLLSERSEGLYQSFARLNVSKQHGVLELSVKFAKDSPPWGLAYNIYALIVLYHGELIYYEDYTDQCSSPGISVFPGEVASLGSVKWAGDGPKENLQIILWGR